MANKGVMTGSTRKTLRGSDAPGIRHSMRASLGVAAALQAVREAEKKVSRPRRKGKLQPRFPSGAR
jgi:acyl-CoA synthetase (NDP forming)